MYYPLLLWSIFLTFAPNIILNIMKPLLKLVIALLLVTLLCPAYSLAQRKSYTIVIDAGHGGHDAGACAYGRKEKDINLAVALLTRQYIEQLHPEIKVYMTRSTDEFIGLRQRANFANKKKANLFISIHTNSAKNKSASGTETYVLGLRRANDNLEISKRENQVILLEKNYKETYEGFDPNSTESYIIFEFMQNAHLNTSIEVASEVQRSFVKLRRGNRSVRQDAFLVLRETSMPSLLIELGFITNEAESEYLASQSGQQELAQGIAEGFSRYYKKQIRSSLQQKQSTTNESSSQETQEPDNRSKPSTDMADPKEYYRIQIASSQQKLETNDSYFRNLTDVQREQRGKLYFYTTEQYTTLGEARKAQKRLAERFPGCYIVRYRNGSRDKDIY
jgi:N-acetylmuramoyl-L-alanine amidase